MEAASDKNVFPILIIIFGILCIGAWSHFSIPLFFIWGALAFVIGIASFFINRYLKQYSDKASIFTFFLFIGAAIVSSGISLSDPRFYLIGGIYFVFTAVFFVMSIADVKRNLENSLSRSCNMPPEIIRLFAVRKGKSYTAADWYCIDKSTGKAYVYLSDRIEATDFETIRSRACDKYACCFMTKEMKKRSYWYDFTEDNWWIKLKIKFDKQRSTETPVQDPPTVNPFQSASKSASSNTQSTGTFVCTVCKKEKSVRYLHHNQICTDCHQPNPSFAKPPLSSMNPIRQSSPKSQEETVAPVLILGNFTFSNADTQKVRSAAARFLPSGPDKLQTYSLLLSYLSSVMDLSLVHLTVDWLWDGVKLNPTEDILKSVLIKTILTVDQTLGHFNPTHLTEMTQKACSEDLLKAWLTLDYYSNCLKSDYGKNIRHYRDYIQNTLMKLEKNAPACDPVTFKDTEVHIDTSVFFTWKNDHPLSIQYEKLGSIPLGEKSPLIRLFEDSTEIRAFRLETEENEDFTGKYFLISVRVSCHGNPSAAAVQLDGYVSDTPEKRQMTLSDIGYRMEVCFLNASGEASKTYNEMLRGKDLEMKGLKYPGYTTPSNIRLIGYCPECGKSFAFHGYAFYMIDDDVVYSDDGLDVCAVSSYEIDKDAVYTVDGKTFRYYNSFNCPHCKTPYIDYRKHPEIKVFGLSGCVLLGKKNYRATKDNSNKTKPDDTSLIEDMKHSPSGIWHQYDVLINGAGYGWDSMIGWADYMTGSDLENISQVTVSQIVGAEGIDIIESYRQNGEACSKTPELKSESGILSIAGISKTLNAPVKIVWFNQTRTLRFFTLIENEELMRKYAETVIGRTFGTKDATKPAKPLPESNIDRYKQARRRPTTEQPHQV